MFTGIVETVGKVTEIIHEKLNKHFCLESDIGHELKVDQSVSHNGVCLTVTKVTGNKHWVTAIDETLKKSNLDALKTNALVNLERCMKADGRFDGHIVQGHVDGTARCESVKDHEGSHLLKFSYDGNGLLVEKGSICVNGVSLTCFNVQPYSFEVAIIPYSWEHTTFKTLKPGDSLNLEFDIIGKYISAVISGRK